MKRFLTATLAGVLGAGTAGAADATAVHVAYFAPDAPGIVRFNVTLDGKPIEEAWAKATDSLFAYFDRNGDGQLDEAERANLVRPAGRIPRRGDPVPDAVGSDLAGKLTFEKTVEKVDKATFVEALKTAGFGPVNVQFLSGRADSGPLTTALFRHLDANGDGKLSADELATARERLEFLDVNEDEWLTTPELLARAVTANTRRLVAPGMRGQEAEAPANPNDLLVLNGQTLKAVKQLLAARGKPKATTLGRTEMGMGEKLFATFDRDGNGQLDTDELLAWLKQPPMLTVNVSLSSDAAKSTVKPRGLELVAGTRFDIAAPTGTSGPEWTVTASQLRAAFKAAAKDGVVEKDKLKDQPALTAAFATLDRNADGKLDEKELTAALDAFAALAVCRADVSLVDQGRGLFEIVDANGDAQLSARELAEVPKALKPFVAADGSITKAQVPRSFPVRSAAAGIRVLSTAPVARDAMVFIAMMDAPRPTPASNAAPAWFLKMDRNADGDVSRKEFLGPLDMFQKLDVDGDGLISAEEAKAAK